MSAEERGKLYDKVYDQFIELIKGNIDKVVISDYELYELNKTHYWTDTDGLIVYGVRRNNSYADALSMAFKDKNIIQEKDIINNNYIFRISRKDLMI